MIITAHQPGYLPGVSVLAKVARADAVVWLDDARFTMPGWVNRNQLPNGQWLTIPVDRDNHRTPIREVTIAGGGWRGHHLRVLREQYGECEHYDQRLLGVIDGIRGGAGEPLVDLNLALIDLLLGGFGLSPRQHRQHELELPAGGSLSTRIAKMVRAVGGTTYLSGPSTRLDPGVFANEGVELTYFTFAGPNPSAIDALFREGGLPSAPRQEVSAP